METRSPRFPHLELNQKVSMEALPSIAYEKARACRRAPTCRSHACRGLAHAFVTEPSPLVASCRVSASDRSRSLVFGAAGRAATLTALHSEPAA
eukprot:6176945-Pleurochrysis_carterae.AAC.1